MIGGQDNHRQPPPGEILLIADILASNKILTQQPLAA
jgi:hypothetical protein